MRSGLPIYWCPCLDGGTWKRGLYGTYWKFDQGQVLETAPESFQNWFLYALTKPADADPIAFLSKPQGPTARAEIWKTSRNMWCTAPRHAASYTGAGGSWVHSCFFDRENTDPSPSAAREHRPG